MKKYLILLAFAAASCGGDDSAGGSVPVVGVQAAGLLFPEQNSECTAGEPISATESKITFQWNAAPGADSYVIHVQNLNTNAEQQFNPGNATSYALVLRKGVPYRWYVTARNATSSADSAKWKFYNAGDGVTGYAPFPADCVAPSISSAVTGTTVTLQWLGADPDSDLTQYKVYFGTDANPTNLIATTAAMEVANVSVLANTAYYWRVDSIDSQGNVSHSGVFQFRTL